MLVNRLEDGSISIDVMSINAINSYYNKYFDYDNDIDEISKHLQAEDVRYFLKRRELLKHSACNIAFELHTIDSILRYFFMKSPYDNWYDNAMKFSKNDMEEKV